MKDTAITKRDSSGISGDIFGYLFKIEGLYTLNEDIEDCRIKLNIFKTKEALKYQLEVCERTLNGDVLLSLNERKDGYYIT